MPIYEIRGPDGKTYSIEGPEGATREQVISAIKSRLGAPKRGAEQAGFLESFRESALGLGKAPEAARFALAEPGTADEARKALLEAQKPEKATTSWEDVKDLASAVDWAKQTAGSSAGYLVAPAVLSTATKLLTKAPGAAKALGYGALGAQYLIDNLSRQAGEQEAQIERGEAPTSTSIAKAGAAAAGQSALDAAGFKFFKPLFGRFPFLKNLVGEAGEKASKEAEDALIESLRNNTLRKRSGVLVGMAKGAGFEIPQEIGQQALERLQAGLSLTDNDARREYYESAAGAVLLGAPLGGMGRFYQNKEKIEQAYQIQLLRDIQREEDKQKQKAAEEEATTEEKKAEKQTKKELREAEITKQLDAARGILFGRTDAQGAPITAETEAGEFERALIGQGITAKDALATLKRLEKEGVITPRDPIKGVRSLVPEAKEYDLTGQVKAQEEPPAPSAVEEIKFEDEVPMGVPPAPAPVVTPPVSTAPAPAVTPPAAVQPTPPIPPVTITPPATEARGAEDVITETTPSETDVGAVGAGPSESVQRARTVGPGVAAVAATGVGDTGGTAQRAADRETKVESTLENWRVRLERDKSRFAEDDPKSPINLINRINKLKKTLAVGEGTLYTSDIENLVSYLKSGADIETAAKQSRITGEKLRGYIADLREAGILTDDDKLNPEAFEAKQSITKSGKKGRVIPSDYDRFLASEAIPLVEVTQDLDKLIDKYDAEGAVGDTGEIRSRIDASLSLLEKSVEDSKESGADLAAREAESLARAQRGIEANIADDLLTYGRDAFDKSLRSGNVDDVLDYIVARADENQQDTAPSVAGVVERLADKETAKIRPAKIDTEGLTKEQADKKIKAAERKAKAEAARVRAGIEADLSGTTFDINSARHHYNEKNRFVKELASRLRKLGLSGVKLLYEGAPGADKAIFSKLKKNGRVAEYDAKTNTIYVTTEGATPKILLHEMVHAATVRVLNGYLNPSSNIKLTTDQRDAAEHIVKIYEAAKSRIGKRFPRAFENPYEFVTYAMTEPKFQQELARMRRPSLAKYTKVVQDFWEQFTEALSRMFRLLTPTEVRAKIQQQTKRGVAKAVGKKLLPEDLFTKGALKGIDKDELAAARMSVLQDRFEEAQRDPEGNLLLEVSEGFHQILMPPEGGIEMEPLAAKAAPPAQERAAKDIKTEYRRKLDNKHPTDPPIRGAVRFLKTHEGTEWLIRKFQNDRRPIKVLQDALVKAGKLIVGEENFNNIYSLISLSSGNAFHVMTQYFQKDMQDVHQSIEAYAKARGLGLMDALSDLNLYMIALHEPERRLIKFLRTVPLDNIKLISFGGVTKTAAEHRRAVFDLLRTNTALTKDQVAKLREFVESLAGYKDGKKVGMGYIDAINGKSLNPNVKPGKLSGDINDGAYNVAGEFTPTELEKLRADYKADTHKALVDRMIDAMQRVQKNTIEQDKKANYWSQPVDNIVNFYNFKNYVPLKGKPNSAETEDEREYNYTGKRLSGEMAESAQSFEGRISDADNVIMQTLVDGAKSAMRAGRKDVTQAIRNLITYKPKPLIDGKIITKKPIPFADRERELESSKYKGDDKIYHYRPDGSVEVMQINDRKVLESIRRVYREKSPFIDMANRITSGIGQSHTRYNPAFHPYNFIRDILTNAFTLGAERGPEWTQRFLNNVTSRVAHGGMMKAAKISKLYAEGNVAAIEAIAQKDPFSASILEYLQEGGRISYVQGLAIRGQIDELVRDINRGKWVRQKEKIDKWVDIWTDMFELTSRAAAYETAKSEALARGMSERAARQEAAAYAKNLANFEQVGEWGKQAGALYMFFRPAATGAVRAIDSITPVLVSVDTAVSRLPEAIRSDPAAVNRFKANFMKEKRDAQAMMLGLLGAGFTLYAMAFAAADDDDLGRNKVATEDMSLWTRNLRLPLSLLGVDNLKDSYLQLPWGFGLGSFGAMGAQVGGMAMGRSSLADGLANTVTIALDSFLPLPVARFDPMSNFPAWMMDSLAPSMARPWLEFVMNVDTFGREIYNNRISKYGDAFTGGSQVPELYNRAARKLFEITNAQADVSPNTMYFFANNYIDGLSRIIHNGLNTYLWASGNKEFDPKRDVLFMDSFFGKKSSYDAREFAEVEKKITDKEKRINALKERPELMQRYLESNPNDIAIVSIYNKLKNQQLKTIRAEINRVKSADYTPKERQDRLRQLELARDFTMRGIIDTFKQFGLEP